MELTKTVNAINLTDGKTEKVSEKVVSDYNVKLLINNHFSRNFSTIPDSLEEFATGYILGEGLVANAKDIKKIEIDELTIKVTIDPKNLKNDEELVLVSDSSGGWRSKIDLINKVESDLAIDKDDLINNMEKLRKNAFIWQETGGTHVAAIINKNKFIVKEDVSRHVAVDKVIGAGALEKFDFSQSYIIYSGRMPADMLIKVARVGIPILASNAAPSFSGYTVANKANITMVGFVRENRFNIYTNPDRIII
ncbi:MAG: formate dehydrogenase accessory sulfurtransferase FdhD [Methanobacteriaceae archaeon]|jgi:FdhD protein/cysteine desulfurase|nr:formate dehydrogenase accessory sulfurtransferase FdhD [Candidatus Methanorudis spinitermitis]